MVAELCTQCATTRLLGGTGESWCNSMLCAFLRAYDVIAQLLQLRDLETSFIQPLEGVNGAVITQLLPLYVEAEKTATGLLWQMSTLLRYAKPESCVFVVEMSLQECCSPTLLRLPVLLGHGLFSLSIGLVFFSFVLGCPHCLVAEGVSSCLLSFSPPISCHPQTLATSIETCQSMPSCVFSCLVTIVSYTIL